MKQEFIRNPLVIEINLTSGKALIAEQTNLVDLDNSHPCYVMAYDIDPTNKDNTLMIILPPHVA